MNVSNDLMSNHADVPSPHARVLGLGGSPRRGGNSDMLLQHIVEGAMGQGIAADRFYLREFRYGACIGCERCRRDKICTGLKDGMSLLYPKILASKGLVLVSPTHHYNVTAWMKAFIDRLYCFYDFEDSRPRAWSSRLAGQGRKAVLAAVCEQTDAGDMGFTLEAMRRPVQALGYDIVGELPVFGIFDKGGVKGKSDALTAAEELGTRLGEAMS